MSEFTQSDTNEVIEITYSNEVLDISGGAEFKKTEGIDLSNDPLSLQRVKDAAEKAKIEQDGGI